MSLHNVADSVVSDILALCGLTKMQPWQNTRSTGALDAGTDSARRAPSARLPYFECLRRNVRHEVSMSSSSDKYLPSMSATDSVVPGVTLILDL